jgi:hypothetical protein
MKQSGRHLVKAREESQHIMEADSLDMDLFEASAWRERIRGPFVHIRDCNKDEILKYFDMALRAARGFRSKSCRKGNGDE